MRFKDLPMFPESGKEAMLSIVAGFTNTMERHRQIVLGDNGTAGVESAASGIIIKQMVNIS